MTAPNYRLKDPSPILGDNPLETTLLETTPTKNTPVDNPLDSGY